MADGKPENPVAPSPGTRRRLPPERRGITRRFVISPGSKAEQKFYVTVNVFEDGTPGEIFVRMAKTGALLSGLLDSWAISTSMALQHWTPLRALCDKMAYTRFGPSGWTGDPEIPYASSIMDWIGRWMAARFLGEKPLAPPTPMVTVPPAPPLPHLAEPPPTSAAPAQLPLSPPTAAGSGLGRLDPAEGAGPPCGECGHLMVRTGKCWTCPSCFGTDCG